uniref:Leucine carboxyl methyltransferase 1 n=1 Tax=Phallusia mammillata TaxID=59560 RepID=A0A6F9DJ03_9ASCI|nr:leucine carboxyl methyltransferase 1-like [Phallusia mammillata]
MRRNKIPPKGFERIERNGKLKMSLPSAQTDIATQATCDDAASCKRYAVQKGYWSDIHINYMVSGSMQKRQPEISRGYYARTEKIWNLISQFVSLTNNLCQIVSFGAGLDTTFWRLHSAGLLPTRYIEVDFQEIVYRKIRAIRNKSPLKGCLGSITSSDQSSLHCEKYHLVTCDLRDTGSLKDKLKSSEVDFSVPTLFLTECVLVYIPPEDSMAILKWCAESFTDAVFVNYEQVRMHDNFGQVMIQNLKARDCLLTGVHPCASLDSQIQRFTSAGWPCVSCDDMWTIYNSLPDRRRIERIELLDESELLQQLMEHYCLCVAVKDVSDIGLTDLHT